MIASLYAKYETNMSSIFECLRHIKSVDRQTNRQTDRQTDRKGDYYKAPAFSMQGPNKCQYHKL